MKSIVTQLRDIFGQALVAAFGDAASEVDPLIRQSGEAKFGDYQSNVAMGLAKTLSRKPRDVAQAIVDALTRLDRFDAMCEPPEIAGPGFINLRLKPVFLERSLAAIPAEGRDDRLGIDRVPEADRHTVVVDLSSPNVAKQMHVGHLRSTIIGDTMARVLEFEGHEVVRQNHIGDWGTQFGIILEQLRESGRLTDEGAEPPGGGFDPDELEAVYRAGQARMKDAGFGERARGSVVRLQAGAPAELRAWRQVVNLSLRSVLRLYERLNAKITAAHTRAESFFDPMLPGIVEEVRLALPADAPASGDVRGVCRTDQGALCIFLERPDGTPLFKNPEGNPLPLIVQKSDGAYLYASTDLAAALFRVYDAERHPVALHSAKLKDALERLGTDETLDETVRRRRGLGGERILYFVGAPQKLHFEMLFATIRALGWTRGSVRDVELQHVAFGSVLGEDRKPLKTRSGENVKLRELLDEAVARARGLVDENDAKRQAELGQAALSEAEKADIAEAVGIASVKYADLSQNRNSDYVFSWDKMLAMHGNTAPYLMYAYARIRSIFRKGAEAGAGPAGAAGVILSHPAEQALAKRIVQLAETLEAVSDALYPHLLCDYLYDLAGKFNAFYENCPVVRAPDEPTRASRLRLCDLTARTLKLGLDLLGIRVLEKM